MFRGGSRGGGGFRGGASRGAPRGRGGFRGGRGGFGAPLGPPERIIEAGQLIHACEGELIGRFDKMDPTKVPYFNGRIFLDNKTEIGKIDEIFGPLNKMFVSIKMMEGVKADSLPPDTKIFIDAAQILPLERFLPKPPVIKGQAKPRAAGAGRGGRGGGRGGAPRGGARGGGFRGGRGAPRGAFRGGRGGY